MTFHTFRIKKQVLPRVLPSMSLRATTSEISAIARDSLARWHSSIRRTNRGRWGRRRMISTKSMNLEKVSVASLNWCWNNTTRWIWIRSVGTRSLSQKVGSLTSSRSRSTRRRRCRPGRRIKRRLWRDRLRRGISQRQLILISRPMREGPI